MKNILIGVIVVLASLFVSSCASSNTADPGEEFTLAPGQSQVIKGENLEITFLRVKEDSRCPTGATCIWEGRATSVVSIMSNNTTEVELTEPGLTDSRDQATFGDYWITYHLLPYPEVGKSIAPGQYRLSMSVSRVK